MSILLNRDPAGVPISLRCRACDAELPPAIILPDRNVHGVVFSAECPECGCTTYLTAIALTIATSSG